MVSCIIHVISETLHWSEQPLRYNSSQLSKNISSCSRVTHAIILPVQRCTASIPTWQKNHIIDNMFIRWDWGTGPAMRLNAIIKWLANYITSDMRTLISLGHEREKCDMRGGGSAHSFDIDFDEVPGKHCDIFNWMSPCRERFSLRRRAVLFIIPRSPGLFLNLV